MTLTGSFEAHDFQMSTDQKGNNKKLLLTTVGDVLMAGVVLVYFVMPVSASYELPFLFNFDRAVVLTFQFLFCFVLLCFILFVVFASECCFARLFPFPVFSISC